MEHSKAAREDEVANSETAEPPCVIRHPQQGDHRQIADLATQLGYPSADEQIVSRLAGMADEDHAVRVAELPNGEIAGWVAVYIRRSVEADPAALISGLVVDGTTRSRGIGKMLLAAAEEWARCRGCHAIFVASNVIRSRAHTFYRNNGFTDVKTQGTFIKQLRD